MRNLARGITILIAAGGLCISAARAQQRLAQVDIGGSVGGSIGGSIQVTPAAPPKAARAHAPRPRPSVPRAAPQRAARPIAPERQAARPRSAPSFDGAWAVSSSGPCAAAGSSQVIISGHNIIGQGGQVGGHVSSSGAVSTLSNMNGITIVGSGRIVGNSASGSYRQSDGCSSSWTAIKM